MKIEIKNLYKKYDNFYALEDINFILENGMYGLLGSNGAGKTTLMKILAGILRKSDGEISYDGKILRNTKEVRNRIGYIPQNFSFYPDMTVYEIMDYFSALNMIKKNRKETIEKLLEMVHLEEKKNLRTKALSGGMRQRLGIAVSLIGNPDLLLVDEPTVGLDPEERIHFSNILTEFSRDRTILLSSHIVSDIESTCKNLAILNYGRLIFTGSKEKLIKSCCGKVWELTVKGETVKEIEKEYHVTHKNIYDELTLLRIISKQKPFEHAVEVEPTLNDAYIYVMNEDKYEDCNNR